MTITTMNNEKGNLKLYFSKDFYSEMFPQAINCDLITWKRVMPTRIFFQH